MAWMCQKHDNDNACAEFVGCIADELKSNVLEEALKVKYISVITDCGTDVSGKDNVITYCRYVSDGTPKTHLVGLAKIDYGDAEGIQNTIKSLLQNADPTNPNWWVHKMSAFGADGASVNMSATGGIGALFRKEIFEHALSFHFFTPSAGTGNAKHTKLAFNPDGGEDEEDPVEDPPVHELWANIAWKSSGIPAELNFNDLVTTDDQVLVTIEMTDQETLNSVTNVKAPGASDSDEKKI
ncbi:ZN862 protein, partial [Polypterus senegalus]